jgi:acylphosphatase
MNETKKTVRAVICGRVQGVGYRAWVRAEAEARGIAGWVRNCSGGDVEALFAGPAEAVDALCAACWRGPWQARVDRVEVREAGAGEISSGRFEVRF